MKELHKIIERQNENGGQFWSRTDGNIHAPNGSSTIDTLFALGEIGSSIQDDPVIGRAIDFIFTYQAQEGSFNYSLKSPKLPCITARIIAAMGRFGKSTDKRIEKSYCWLLKTQWNDGGWRCATVKLG